MQRKLIPLLVLASALLFSCKSKTENKEKPDFIDVSSYLKGQLSYLDTVPFAFQKTTLKDSVHTDSVFITKEQVKAIALQFLTEDLQKKNFQQLYKETLFGDAGMNTITLTYEPEDAKDLTVQRVDVYVNPETNEIAKMYFIRKQDMKDSSIVQQLLWKHNKSFLLITTTYKNNNEEKVVTEKVNWNDSEE
jgi:hypothetical protein